MIAFCIIVGDTIPHVMVAVFPSFKETSFLWLLTDRRAVITIFILGVSYPLSLYRDISKAGPSTLRVKMQADVFAACKGICTSVDQYASHNHHGHYAGGAGTRGVQG